SGTAQPARPARLTRMALADAPTTRNAPSPTATPDDPHLRSRSPTAARPRSTATAARPSKLRTPKPGYPALNTRGAGEQISHALLRRGRCQDRGFAALARLRGTGGAWTGATLRVTGGSAAED